MTRLLPAGPLLDRRPPAIPARPMPTRAVEAAVLQPSAAPRPSASVLLTVLVVAVEVAVVWLAPFNSQDGPAHSRAAAALGEQLVSGGGEPSLFAANPGLQPNWITYPPFAALAGNVGPRSAELLIVSALIISVVAAGRYATSAFGPKGTTASLLVLPFSMSWYLHVGLYNYVASLAVLLVVIGYWVRASDRLGARAGPKLALLLLVLYFSHPLSLLAGLAFIGTLSVTSGPGWRRRCLVSAAASTPVLLLCAFHLGDGPDQVLRWRSPAAVLRGTVLFRYPLESLGRSERGIITGLAILTLGTVAVVMLGRIRRRRLDRWDGLVVVAAGSVVGAVIIPDRFAGGNLIQPRFGVYAVLAVILWLAAQAGAGRAPNWLIASIGAAAALVALALVVARIEPYRTTEAQLSEVRLAAASLAAVDTYVPIVSRDAPRSGRTKPLLHAHNWLSVDSEADGVVNLDAGTGYGPVVYRDGIDPKPALRGLNIDGTSRPTADRIVSAIRRYERTTGRSIDAVVLIGFDPRCSPVPGLLEAGFEPIVSTEPTGLLVALEVVS